MKFYEPASLEKQLALDLSLRELMSLLALCRVLFTNDSGANTRLISAA